MGAKGPNRGLSPITFSKLTGRAEPCLTSGGEAEANEQSFPLNNMD